MGNDVTYSYCLDPQRLTFRRVATVHPHCGVAENTTTLASQSFCFQMWTRMKILVRIGKFHSGCCAILHARTAHPARQPLIERWWLANAPALAVTCRNDGDVAAFATGGFSSRR